MPAPHARQFQRAAEAAINKLQAHILALKPGGKSPLEHGWQDELVNSLEEAVAWHPKGPYAGCNVGIACGPSGFVVVDPDRHGDVDGIQNLHELVAKLDLDEDEVFDTYTVRTPSGGLHLYYKAPLGPPPVGRDLCAGVNTRSRGQLVVAAGSRTDQGEYVVEKDRPIRRLPAPFAAILAREVESADRVKKFTMDEAESYIETQALAPLRDCLGNRNIQLNNSACVVGHFVPEYWPEDEAQEMLLEAAEECGLVADDGNEQCVATIRSGLRKGMNDWTAVRPESKGKEDEPSLDWKLVSGADFILNTPEQTPAIWGTGHQVLWAEGEPLIITGPTGVGKTTIGAQLILGRIGQADSLLGFDLKPGRKVLYLACDRPKQIARALRRTFKNIDPAVLDERLVFQQGPPPRDLARNPEMLLELAQRVGADTVVVDSVKDVAVKLSDEETGQGLHRAFQLCIANDIEVVAYHHQRKKAGGSEATKPRTIDDMYGSAWIAAGAGSVVLIWGAAGDSRVELIHLKQPAEKVGPLNLLHNHAAGTTSIAEDTGPDLWELLVEAGGCGLTVKQAIEKAANEDQPGRALTERYRRMLDGFVDQGHATKESVKGGSAIYVAKTPG